MSRPAPSCRRRTGSIVMLAAVFGLGCAGHVSSLAVTNNILEADAARTAAMVAGDTATLGGLLDDALTYTHSNGRMDTKGSLLASLTGGHLRYRRIDVPVRAVRIFGDTAVVSGPVRIEVESTGRVHHLAGVFTAVYRRRDGGWRLVAYQSSPFR